MHLILYLLSFIYGIIISLKNLGSKNFILKKIQLNQINNIFYEMKKNRSIGKSIIKF